MLIVIVTTIQSALVWGTEDLTLATVRIPLLATIPGRNRVFEFSAFVLIAVATREVMIRHQRSPSPVARGFRARPFPRDWTVSRRELVVLIAGVTLPAAANYREASQIVEITGF
ncbi:hypothetical protein C492_09160 [Natronococcus jeotgali DSM 18795]|uniref:Uncharacterized protein n=1 Tax=Natronococcus jeotgali DSM 18795 TaxID=1227498 RepID=L9XLX0_9EURY|nr:hypothetical protein C492_09160 [Natronococcus jeotgali DSM 18795]